MATGEVDDHPRAVAAVPRLGVGLVHLVAQRPRITSWLAPRRRIILLTVFRKTRNAEVAEVVRALQAQKTCEAEHGPAHDTFGREAS
jgi:hypothetical protein